MVDILERLRAALAERYAVDRELGRGGMATVYLARDLKHDRLVAIKVLRPALAESLGPGRFLREISIASRLVHPNILPVHDSGSAEGLLFYVMPYVAGESLRDLIRREGQLPVEEAVRIAQEVALGLKHAHAEDVVHRDIKPENILLESGQAVIADFGLARAIHASALDDLSSSGLAIGTPSYMSPEQVTGGDQIDGRSDVYSLGCVLYEMLAGEPPFNGPSAQAIAAKHLHLPPPPLRTVRPSVQPHLVAAIERALEKVPGDRFQTAEEFRRALGQPEHPVAESKPKHSMPLWMWGGGLVGVLLALLAIVAVTRRRHDVSPSPVGLVLIPFEESSLPADSLGAAGAAPHTVLADALAWLPGVRPLDGTMLLNGGQDWHATPLPQLLRGARGLGGRYLLTGAISRVDSVSGSRVTVDLYAVDGGQRVIRAEKTAPPGDLAAALGELALESVRALTSREGSALGSAATLFSATSSAEAVGYLLQGQQKFWGGDYDGAASAFGRAIAADSACGLAYHRLSVAELWNHDFAEALRAADAGLRRGRQLSPRWVSLLQAQRQYALRQGDSAAAAFQRTVLNYPDDIDGWLGLGDVLFHFAGMAPNIPMDSERALMEVITRDSFFAPIYDHLADLAFLKGDAKAARLYMERLPPGDFLRQAREAALTLRFGQPAHRRAALQKLRKSDRQTLSELVRLIIHASFDLPLVDTLAGFLMQPDRTPDDRRRGAEYRLAALSALGRPEEGLAIWRSVNNQDLDGWVLQAYFAGYPVNLVAEPMLSSARAMVSRQPIDPTSSPATELIQALQALVHSATLRGDSSEVLRVLSVVRSAAGDRDSSDPLAPALTASLQARLALLAHDTVGAINLFTRSVGRSLWPYTDFFPLSGMGPQRLLLGRLLASQGQTQGAERWLGSFSNSWAMGDLLFVAPARQVQATLP